jgi:hypothetical protein
MMAFAERTGLEPAGRQRRYLWTDAFAVSSFLGLARATGDWRWLKLALRLVDGVHHALGRHRPDDGRAGWISGLGEKEGEAHPTRGGLRIGKKLPERRADQTFDDDLEWERDGQYFHYLTRWSHALSQTARATGAAIFVAWARELGRAAHDGFVSPTGDRRRHRLRWKMSIDLSRPLVGSTGQHDALDGYLAFLEAEAVAAQLPGAGGPALHELAANLAEMIDPPSLSSADPLAVGSLLMNAHLLEQLMAEGRADGGALVEAMLEAALEGLKAHLRRGGTLDPVERRLAFREAGLVMGLQAAVSMGDCPAPPGGGKRRSNLLQALAGHSHLTDDLLALWLDGAGAARVEQGEHRDLDEVMLASALIPEGVLGL